MTLYRYGPIAWVWRVVLLIAIAAGVASVVLGVRLGSFALGLSGAILLAPSLFFGAVLAVQVDRVDGGVLQVQTLMFWRRRVAVTRLGAPRLRQTAEGDAGSFYAPRAWIPVRGSVPIYIDLLGRIADRRAFGAVFGLTGSQLPNG